MPLLCGLSPSLLCCPSCLVHLNSFVPCSAQRLVFSLREAVSHLVSSTSAVGLGQGLQVKWGRGRVHERASGPKIEKVFRTFMWPSFSICQQSCGELYINFSALGSILNSVLWRPWQGRGGWRKKTHLTTQEEPWQGMECDWRR